MEIFKTVLSKTDNQELNEILGRLLELMNNSEESDYSVFSRKEAPKQ